MFKAPSSTTDVALAHQEQLLPATDDVAQLYAFDLAYQRRFLPVVDAAAQVDRVGPLLTHEALPIADQNDPQRSDLNARTVTGSEQVNTGDEIQEGTHLCHVPSVVDMDYGQHSPSPAGTGDERSLASASGATQGRVEPTQMSKPRKDSQVEGKSRAKVVQKGEVRDSPTGRGIEYKDLRTGVWCELSQYISWLAIATKSSIIHSACYSPCGHSRVFA